MIAMVFYQKGGGTHLALLNSCSFFYDNQDSGLYNLAICYFDGIDADNESGLSVELQRGEFNMVRSELNQYGAIPTDTLRFEFAVMKRDYSNFTFEESRAINNWLRGSNTYKLLRFNDDSPETINYYAVCTNIVDVVISGHVGKKLTFVCNSPFGYTAKYQQKVRATTENPKTISLYNSSDIGIYYPTITVQTAADYEDTVSLINVTDNNKTAVLSMADITPVKNSKTVIIDGKNTEITDANGVIIPAYKIGWDNLDNIYWFRLMPNRNSITIAGDCMVSIAMEFPRKTGII